MFIIFNKEFEPLSVELLYSSFKWVRKTFEAGEFVFMSPFTDRLYDLLQKDNYIYKRSVNEACIIDTVESKTTSDGEDIIVVSGKNITSLLDRRMFKFEGKVKISDFIKKIFNDNIVNPSNPNRKIREIMLKEVTILNDIEIEVDINDNSGDNGNIYNYLTKILEDNQINIKAEFNYKNKTIDFSFTESEYNGVSFSNDFNNVLEQDYFASNRDYKNVVYVEGKAYFDDINGIERREATISKSSEKGQEQQNVDNYLNEKKEKEMLSTVIDSYSEQFIYIKDWDIGDIIFSKNNRLNINRKQIIREIVEFYDEKGMNLEIDLIDLKEDL